MSRRFLSGVKGALPVANAARGALVGRELHTTVVPVQTKPTAADAYNRSFRRRVTFAFSSAAVGLLISSDPQAKSIRERLQSIFETKKRKESLTNIPDPRPAFEDAVIELLKENILSEKDSKLISESLIIFGDESRESSEKKIVPEESTMLFAGRVVDIEGGEILPQEGGQSSIVFVSGLGQSCSKGRILKNHAVLQDMFVGRKVSAYVPASEVLVDEENPVSKERYVRGMAPYFYPNYIDQKGSSDFFDQVIKPRFCDAEGKLLPPEKCQRLLLVNHSIAAREAGSHIRWFIEYLKESGVALEDIEKYTKKILRLNLASPVVEGDEQGPAFHVVSLNDNGSKKPESYLHDVYFNPEFQQSRISTVKLGDERALLVLGFGVVRDGEGTKDGSCHSASSHIVAIKREKELAPMLAACEIFSNPAVSDAEAFSAVDNVIKNAQPFVAPKMSEEELEESMLKLRNAWQEYYLEKMIAERRRAPVNKSLSANPSPAICSSGASPLAAAVAKYTSKLTP